MTPGSSNVISPVISFTPKGYYYHHFSSDLAGANDAEMSYSFGLRNIARQLDDLSFTWEKAYFKGEKKIFQWKFPFFHKWSTLNINISDTSYFVTDNISKKNKQFGFEYITNSNSSFGIELNEQTLQIDPFNYLYFLNWLKPTKCFSFSYSKKFELSYMPLNFSFKINQWIQNKMTDYNLQLSFMKEFFIDNDFSFSDNSINPFDSNFNIRFYVSSK